MTYTLNWVTNLFSTLNLKFVFFHPAYLLHCGYCILEILLPFLEFMTAWAELSLTDSTFHLFVPVNSCDHLFE